MTKTIALLREEKVPQDHRAPFSPQQVREMLAKYPNLRVLVQPSSIRCFADSEYTAAGATLSEDLSSADFIFGVKEVPKYTLLADKVYFFFSHTIKEQAYNRELLQKVVEKNIRLVDYEVLTDERGQRLVAFGRFAGIVGAYNALWAWGQRMGTFDLPRASTFDSVDELFVKSKSADMAMVRTVLTGKGRVGLGAKETLAAAGLKELSPKEFLADEQGGVFTHLDVEDYVQRSDGQAFDRAAFFNHGGGHESAFLPFAAKADILVAGAFWDPSAPRLFELNDTKSKDFRISLISDITMDIEGSVPSTLRPATIAEPVYDVCRHTHVEHPAFSAEKHITMVAVDNLPSEVPRDASRAFGAKLMEVVIPEILGDIPWPVVDRATITQEGELTENFAYLQNYLEGNID